MTELKFHCRLLWPKFSLSHVFVSSFRTFTSVERRCLLLWTMEQLCIEKKISLRLSQFVDLARPDKDDSWTQLRITHKLDGHRCPRSTNPLVDAIAMNVVVRPGAPVDRHPGSLSLRVEGS